MSNIFETETKIKQIIDELKALSAQAGLANQGEEERIITSVFLYKFLNDKFMYNLSKFAEEIGETIEEILKNENDELDAFYDTTSGDVAFGYEDIISSRGISYNSANLEGDGVPMINLASFGVDSNYKPAGIKTYNGQYDADKILYPFDLIMCNTQQTAIDPTKDIIGKAVLVPDIFDGDVVSSHHVTTITPDVDELKYYLYGTCKTTWFHKYIVGFASGTNILGLDFKGFEDYLMPLPPMRLLKKFATAMKNIESEKNLIITENAELASLRDFLLPMLMNGQVKVKGA